MIFRDLELCADSFSTEGRSLYWGTHWELSHMWMIQNSFCKGFCGFCGILLWHFKISCTSLKAVMLAGRFFFLRILFHWISSNFSGINEIIPVQNRCERKTGLDSGRYFTLCLPVIIIIYYILMYFYVFQVFEKNGDFMICSALNNTSSNR